MKRILCFGDSNTWGYDIDHSLIEGMDVRFDENTRWTQVLGRCLGAEYQVVEAGLGARTIEIEDPEFAYRSGLKAWDMLFWMADPVDCLVIMLGTNDMKSTLLCHAEKACTSMQRLIDRIKQTKAGTKSADMKIILVSPILIEASRSGAYCYGFNETSAQESRRFKELFGDLARRNHLEFLAASDFAEANPTDGVHLTAQGHRTLGEAIAEKIKEVLE